VKQIGHGRSRILGFAERGLCPRRGRGGKYPEDISGHSRKSGLTVLAATFPPPSFPALCSNSTSLYLPEPDDVTLRAAAGPVHKLLWDREGVIAFAEKPKR